MADDGANWRLVRWFLFRLLSRSARKVLLTRELDTTDGARVRWFKSDVARYLDETRIMANDIRPVAKLDTMPSVGNRIMVEFAVFTVAAYRTLLANSVDRQQASRVVADAGWDVYAFLLGIVSLPFRIALREPGARLRNTIRLLLVFPFNAPGAPGYAVQARSDGDDFLTYFTHCPPQHFVRALIAERGDEGDLEAFSESWCNYDWPIADVIAGDNCRGHYSRVHTMSRGDPVCDMCWQAKCQKPKTAQAIARTF